MSRSLENVGGVPAKSSDETESGSPTNVAPPAVLVRLSVKVIGEALACPTTKTKAREHSHTFARRPVPVVARAAFRKGHGVADLHLHKLDEPLVIAWRRVLAIEVIDDLRQVAGQPVCTEN